MRKRQHPLPDGDSRAAAAFAKAFFDATGVRLRGYPFTRKRVLAALT